VTTSWQRFGGVFDIPTNAKNIIVLAWSGNQLTATSGFSLSEVSLSEGGEVQEWAPLDVARELQRVLRYYQKTFNVDAAPAQNAGLNTGELTSALWKASTTASAALIHWRFPVRMRTTPTATTYNPAAASAQVRQVGGTAANMTATATANVNDSSIDITATGVATGTVGDKVAVHATVNAEL
jgi:hypothetical protein